MARLDSCAASTLKRRDWFERGPVAPPPPTRLDRQESFRLVLVLAVPSKILVVRAWHAGQIPGPIFRSVRRAREQADDKRAGADGDPQFVALRRAEPSMVRAIIWPQRSGRADARFRWLTIRRSWFGVRSFP